MNEEQKAVLNNEEFEYIENYAMLGERYVVKCDSSLGKIGDILRFTQNDGTVVECVIGATTVGAASKGILHFIVKDKDNIKEKDICKNILTNNNKIENIGNITDEKKSDTSTTGVMSNGLGTSTAKTTGTYVLNGNVLDTTNPVTTGEKYELSDDDLAFLGYVASSEQGSVDGAKLELSLMANLYEENKNNFSSVRDYVENSGWFGSSYGSEYSYPGDEYIAVAKDILVNGNRYLNSNVVEHDYLGDIVYCSTGDVYDTDSYVPGETVLENQWGAKYVFVGFAPNGGDPFGYLIN